MTIKNVGDLIKALQKCDEDSPVVVAVGSQNRAYPVDYLPIWQVVNKQNGQDTRINVTFPYSVSVRKSK